MLKEMAPRKVARKVTQQPVEALKCRNAAKGKKQEKKKEAMKVSLSAATVSLGRTQNVATLDTNEHTEVDEPAISSSHSPMVNVSISSISISLVNS